MLHLILGGARSGKSSFAERWLLQQAQHQQVTYLATAQALDDEMQTRIARHQKERVTQWQLVECPLELAKQLANYTKQDYLLIDCLTLWLSNQLMQASQITDDIDGYLHQQVQGLVKALNQHPATIVLVSNEVGFGVVPMGRETRLFVDHQGWMNQKLAQIAEQVTLVTAGLPMTLKEVTND